MAETSSTQSRAVVLHYRDGSTARYQMTEAFGSGATAFRGVTADGEVVTVPLDDLKAVFFLKDPRRRAADMAIGANGIAGGAKAIVEFTDGEVLRGRVLRYSVADKGFYLYPTDPESNNERVFVVATALANLSLDT